MKKLFFLFINLCLFPFFIISQDDFAIINSYGDTIPTGVPISVTGKWLNPNLFEAPRKRLVQPPLRKKFYNNTFPIGSPEVISIQKEKLRTAAFGKNGIPFPQKRKLNIDTVPALHPSPTPITAPAFKDIATHNIRFLDVEHGLKSSYYHTVFEDSRGYLWFGSWGEGLSRYDGKSLTTFTEEEGLPNNSIRTILEDRQGNMWFGTGAGPCMYDGFYFYHYPLDDMIQFIFEDSKNRIWFTSEHNGLGYMDDNGDFINITEEEGLPNNFVTSMAEDKNGDFWISHSYGFSKFDGRTFTNYSEEDGLIKNEVTKLLIDQQGNIWAATDNGVSKFDGNAFTNFTTENGLSDFLVWHALEDQEGNIWFGTRRGGACKFDGENFTHYKLKEGLSNIEVLSLFEDSRGQIWMTTYGGGINVINPSTFTNYTTEEGLLFNMVNHILEDSKKNIWLISETAGIIKYDGEYLHYYTTEQGLLTNEIVFGLEDRQGNFWFSAIGGIIKYDGKYFSHYTSDQGLLADTQGSILEDKNGNIWIATLENGVFKFDGTAFTQFSEAEGLMSNIVLDLIEDDEGNLWIGTEGGATKYDGKSFTHYSVPEGLTHPVVSTFSKDSRGQIWMSSDGGTDRFDGKRITSFTKENGLANTETWATQVDHKDNVWVGTENGIYFLEASNDTISSEELHFVPFHHADGIKGEDVRQHAVCLDSKNQLWWGTGKSLSKFDLNTFYKNKKTRIPKVQLNNIYLNENLYAFSIERPEGMEEKMKEVGIEFDKLSAFRNIPKGLQVPYDLNHFTFDFIALDHVAPHKIFYQYQIEGLENDWSQPTTENKIDYRSIPFGRYTFKVRAKNESGIWSEALEFPFKIHPPWWHSNLAYFGYFLILLGIGYLIFSFLKKRWMLQNELKLEQAEALRLKELDAFKSKFYTNITHEFRTPLTVILGMAREIKERPQKFLVEGIQLIERNGKKLLEHINQILDLSKLENNAFRLNLVQDDIIAFLRYSTEAFQSYANGQNISLRFFSNQEKLMMDFDPDYLQKVISNLISNALKFTPSGGDVKVRVIKKEEQLIIEVLDTGIGISQKDLPHIFDRFYRVENMTSKEIEGTGIGLAHTKELVKIMNGVISVESEEKKGTTFLIELPIQRLPETVTTLPKKQKLKTRKSKFSKHTEENILDSHLTIEGIQNSKTNSKSQPEKETVSDNRPTLLLVEDNPDVVIYLKNCLGDLYDIEVAYNGKIGIEKAIETVPDLIISDVMMPEKDGFEVCNAIKNDERTSHIPLILLTAKADVSSKIAGLKRGADAYLAKPFDKEELLVRLEMLVERQKKMVSYFSQKIIAVTPQNIPEAEVEEAIQIEDAFIQKVKKIIEENYSDENFALPQLCQKIRMSRSQLFRKMKALVNTSPSEFIRKYRLEKAKYFLETTDMNVSEVSWEVGFKDVSHFSKAFQNEFGYLPSEVNHK